ncbi:DUF167 domain-containing protein [Cerasicoccus arenae]|nr:DUF167 domain-containing protein [Cerasicoccus arenae]MBK1859160.1 YggU family protein [Cerasicoccus arenae]
MIRIFASPKASRTEIAGWQEDTLKVRIAAPPVDGQANTELVKFLAKHLGLPKRAVTIVSGEGGRRKVIAVEEMSTTELMAKLPPR